MAMIASLMYIFQAFQIPASNGWKANVQKALNVYIWDAIMAINQFEKGCTFANTFLSTFLHQAHVCAPENILKLITIYDYKE